MRKNKGIVLINLAITIIVIIILSSLTIWQGVELITNSNKATFLESFENAVYALDNYNTKAVMLNHNKTYSPELLIWDGYSKKAQNTARIEKEDEEDSISYILNDMDQNTNLKDKLEIVDGDLYIKSSFKAERDWASEKYKYLRQ